MAELPDDYQTGLREEMERGRADQDDRLPFDETFYRYFAYLIDIDRIPQDVLFALWGVAHRVHQLTRFNDSDVRIMMREVDIIFTHIRHSIPEYDYDYSMQNNLKQMKLMFYSMIKRSSGEGFERKMQATQITQQEHIVHQPKYIDEGRSGILDRAGGLIGFKKRR